MTDLLWKFGRLSWRDRLLLVEAAFWLTIATIVVAVLPGRSFGGLAAVRARQREEPQRMAARIGRICWAIVASARRLRSRIGCLFAPLAPDPSPDMPDSKAGASQDSGRIYAGKIAGIIDENGSAGAGMRPQTPPGRPARSEPYLVNDLAVRGALQAAGVIFIGKNGSAGLSLARISSRSCHYLPLL